MIEELVDELKLKLSVLAQHQKIWIGMAGAPGSGKSTLVNHLSEQFGDLITVIPMDGFHYCRDELDIMPNAQEAHARRGAPFTFNAQRCVDSLIKAHELGEGCFPSFDHHIGDPIENDIVLSQDTSLVIVEGNYLLLDDAPWYQLKQKVFDETWFLSVPIDICCERVVYRHMQQGMSESQARHRVENNDRKNAQLVTQSSLKNADRIVRLDD